jgi:ABC-type multidrug transport system fused ATPase/permease subunit
MLFFNIFVKGFLEENFFTFITYVIIIILFFPFETVVLPKLYGNLFDVMKNKISPNVSLFDFFENIQNMNLQGTIVGILLAWIIIVLSYAAKHHYESILVPDFMTYMRKILYEKTLNAYKEDYEDVKTGEYLSRMLELIRNSKDLFYHIINGFFPYLCAITVVIIYLSTQNREIGGVLVTASIIVCIINYFAGEHLVKKVTERETFMNTEVNQNIQNTVDNLMNIYINNESGNEIDKNTTKENKACSMMENIMFIENLIITSSYFIILSAYGYGLYLVYKLLLNKKLTSASAIVFVLMLGEFLSYGMDLSSGFVHNVLYKFGIINASKDYIENILVDNNTRIEKDVIREGTVTFKDIVFRYKKDSDEVLFDGLNLEIKGGTKIGVIGRSGSGKTTLMKMLVGLYKPEEGEISIDGVDINTIDIEYLRSEVNYLNQKTQLFEDTILYNMKYGNTISEDEIYNKLQQYGLLDVFSDLPGGVKANAGLNGGNLSGGMQKITILMRGILKPGKIIVLDEPLAGLDKGSIEKVINMILHETKGKTVIIITHDNAILPHMDTVVNINDLH